MWFLSFFLLLTVPAQASMSDLFAELFGPPERKSGTRASYDIRQYKTSDVHGTNSQLNLRQHQIEMSTPLSQDYDKKWKLLLNTSLDEIDTSAQFPNGKPLPHSLWNIEAGLSHIRKLEGDDSLAGSFTVGSPSDHPFSAFRDVTFQGNIMFKSSQEENAWLFFLSLSNARGFLDYIPLPGIAYSFKATNTLRIIAGIPFVSLFWNPWEKTVVSFFYFPTYNTQLRVSYFLFGPAQLYFQAKYQSKNYFLTERTAQKERIFYDEGILQSGISMPLEKFVLANLSFGYTFERKYFLGTRSSAWRDGQLRRLEKSPFADLKLNFIF